MWSQKRLSLTESTRIQAKRSNPDAFGPPTRGAHVGGLSGKPLRRFRTTHARSPPKTEGPRRVLDRAHPDSQWESAGAGVSKAQWACARPYWGRLRCIGAGCGALGHLNNLPQWGLTCPSRWFPAPMRRWATVSSTTAGTSGVKLPLPRCPAAPLPQCAAGRCFHSDTPAFTAMPDFASVITLAK